MRVNYDFHFLENVFFFSIQEMSPFLEILHCMDPF